MAHPSEAFDAAIHTDHASLAIPNNSHCSAIIFIVIDMIHKSGHAIWTGRIA